MAETIYLMIYLNPDDFEPAQPLTNNIRLDAEIDDGAIAQLQHLHFGSNEIKTQILRFCLENVQTTYVICEFRIRR